MKLWIVIVALALFFVTADHPTLRAQESDDALGFAFHECPFTVPNHYEIDCGYLTVPEDRTEADTNRTIQLAVAIIHSYSSSPLPDPVVYLNGGPGGSSLPIISAGLSPLFDAILMNRDVIFVDQRGTGYSFPSLNCPEIEHLNLSIERSLFVPALNECRERLATDGVNVAAYNSAASAADIADLRTALGYEAWNLYGVSYGTRLALTILRDDPQGVRSVVLNSTMPPTASLYLEGGGNFHHALELIFAACQQDMMCHLAYPDLSARLYTLLEQLDSQPITIQGVSIDRFILTDLIFNALYSPDLMAVLPAAIYDMSDGDYSILESTTRSGTSSPVNDKTFSEGMFYSVQCSESASFHTYAQIIASLTPYPEAIQQYWQENVLFGAAALNACDVWLSVHPDSRENQPVYSDIPALVLSGEFDPITPSHWGQEAAATLKGSYFYEFPRMGHNVAGTEPCPTSIILGFLNQPLNAPESGCIKEMPPSTFLIRAAFSIPFVQGAVAIMAVITVLWLARLHPYFHRRWTLGWRMSRHFVGSWYRNIGLIGLVIIAYALTLPYWEQIPLHLRVLEIIFPFLFGLQTALIFPPDDEPALEVMLVCPRPVMFVVIERLLTLIIVQGSVISAMTLLSLTMPLAEALPLALARWLIPSFFIGSLALYISIVARRATFGLLLTVVICMVSIVGGDYVVGGYPFLWFLHLYLQPADVIPPIYFLNRLVLLLAAGLIFVRTLHLLANDEHLLNVK
jgi:pimeloyl-ACP methyl ester carboxylesterase